MYKEPHLTVFLKAQSISIYARMDKVRLTEMAFTRKSVGNKRKGIPRIKIESMIEDLQKIITQD